MKKLESDEILFPFGRIMPNEKILIYGAGKIGRIFFHQISRTNYCLVKGFVDKNARQKQDMSVPVYGIDDIKTIEYDSIVIAVRDQLQRNLIRDRLINEGVSESNIVQYAEPIICNNDEEIVAVDGTPLAFQLDAISIAIRLGNGIGDSIIVKKFWEAISKLSSRMKIDIYTRNNMDDVIAIYRDEVFFNRVIVDSSDYCEKNKCHYHLTVNHGNFPEIEWISPQTEWSLQDYPVYDIFKKIIVYREKYKGVVSNFPFIHYHKQIYLKNNCYSSLSCEGLIPIDGHKVNIAFDDIGRNEFKHLNLGKYITLNYGNGSSMEQADKINKQWPYRHFVKFVELFQEKYSNINIVQIGAENAIKVKGVDRFLHGRSLEVIKHVLHGAVFHLDIEGGMVHLATQLGTKCIVLFGPTLEEFYAYPENINISAGNCHGCWELYGADRICAKKLPYPECMALITPEKVMEKVDEYLKWMNTH